ncbi:MAG: hypothetical protein JHC95_13245 [Solirubrobacteraceae bacterium]|nr:hypothetical protein [Solirubrobacteraceae bacterium]
MFVRASFCTVALMLLAGLLPAAAAEAAKKPKCKKGQVAWKLEGRTRCLKAVKVTLPRKAPARSQLAVTRLLTAATTSHAKVPGTELTPDMRRLLKRPAIAAAAAKAEELARKPAIATATATRMTLRASRSIVGPTFEDKIGSTSMTGTTGATLSDDGQVAIELGMRIAQGGGTSTEMKVGVELSPEPSLTSVCPDETGKVVIERTSGGSLTTLIRKGGNVESAETVRTRTITRSVGQVGADGRLETVSSTATTTTTIARRGLQIGVTTREAVAGPRGAPGKSTGVQSVAATVKSDSFSGDVARQVEANIAARTAADATDAKIEGSMSDTGRTALNEASKNWESLENNGMNACVRVTFTPGPGSVLKTGESKAVKGKAVAANGGKAVAAKWTVMSVSPGKFAGGGTAGAGGQTFTATGGKREGAHTVLASVLIESVAGRVRMPWFATDQPSYTFELNDNETGTFATHEAAGVLNVKRTLEAVPGSKPVRFTADSVGITWVNPTAVSKVPPCTYISPTQNGRLTVSAVQTGDDALTVTMSFTGDSSVLWTVSCPSPDGPPAEVPGQLGVSVLAMQPTTFTVPLAGGVQPIGGAVEYEGYSIRSNGTVTIKPVGS